jgi:hypothetical protein
MKTRGKARRQGSTEAGLPPCRRLRADDLRRGWAGAALRRDLCVGFPGKGSATRKWRGNFLRVGSAVSCYGNYDSAWRKKIDLYLRTKSGQGPVPCTKRCGGTCTWVGFQHAAEGAEKDVNRAISNLKLEISKRPRANAGELDSQLFRPKGGRSQILKASWPGRALHEHKICGAFRCAASLQ